MRFQTSVTLVSLLIASVTIGLYQSEYHSSGLQPVDHVDSLHGQQLKGYLCHRGSGRLENDLNSAEKRSFNLVAIATTV